MGAKARLGAVDSIVDALPWQLGATKAQRKRARGKVSALAHQAASLLAGRPAKRPARQVEAPRRDGRQHLGLSRRAEDGFPAELVSLSASIASIVDAVSSSTRGDALLDERDLFGHQVDVAVGAGALVGVEIEGLPPVAQLDEQADQVGAGLVQGAVTPTTSASPSRYAPRAWPSSCRCSRARATPCPAYAVRSGIRLIGCQPGSCPLWGYVPSVPGHRPVRTPAVGRPGDTEAVTTVGRTSSPGPGSRHP